MKSTTLRATAIIRCVFRV